MTSRKYYIVLCLLTCYLLAQALALPQQRSAGNKGTRKGSENFEDSKKFTRDEDLSDSGEDDADDDDLDDDDDGELEIFDQKQNGTENYMIRVNGLLLILTPSETQVPEASSTTEKPALDVNLNNTIRSHPVRRNPLKRRNNHSHGTSQGLNWINHQRNKLSKYQVRIPHFIMSLLNGNTHK